MTGSSSKELAGRVAIITGAGRNIGRSMALQFAQAGASVLINTRSNRAEAEAVKREVEALGVDAAIALGDVADPKTADLLADTAVKQFGRIDYLINNAAVRAEQPLDELDFGAWRAVLSVILDGAFHCVKACVPELKKSGAGAIVNIGGMSAHIGSKHRVHVITAKSGLAGFSRALAHDLADFNVTVNTVVPGMINTPRDPNLPEPQHHSTHKTLSGKRGAPDDLAGIVRFLCGPGGRFITGQTIQVNGGAYLT